MSAFPREVVQTKNQIDPVLKSWLDNIIIPTLVAEYLREPATGNAEVSSQEEAA